MDSNKLRAKWSKRESDVMIYYPDKRDGALLHHYLTQPDIYTGNTLLQELDSRGYDITTLKFEIQKLLEKK